MYAALCSFRGQIRDDYFPRFFGAPFVGKQTILCRFVVTGHPRDAPLACVEDIVARGGEKFGEKLRAGRIDRLIGYAAQLDRRAELDAELFALLVKAHAGKSAHQSSGRFEASVTDYGGEAFFIVVFQEASEMRLFIFRPG